MKEIVLVMLMAGNGKRFTDAGYNVPKPLIEINGMPMFVSAINCLGIKFDKYVFVTKKEHNIKSEIQKLYNGAEVIELDHITEGAACTALLTESVVDKDAGVMFINCDQIVDLDSGKLKQALYSGVGIVTVFKETEQNPKWSYAHVDTMAMVSRVAEKQVISDTATCGHYYWYKASEFYSSVRDMIAANDRVNDEFYLCPVINYSITRGISFEIFLVDEMNGIGTPEDLELWRSK